MFFLTWRHGQGKSPLQSTYFFAFSPISTRLFILAVEPSERLFEQLSEWPLAVPKSD